MKYNTVNVDAFLVKKKKAKSFITKNEVLKPNQDIREESEDIGQEGRIEESGNSDYASRKS